MKTESPQPAGNSDPLDALLREADEYTPDNGFTARVVHQLPARRQRRWRRWAVLSVAALISVGLAAGQAPVLVALVCGAWQQPAAWHWQSLLGLIPLLAAFAALIWVGFTLANEED